MNSNEAKEQTQGQKMAEGIVERQKLKLQKEALSHVSGNLVNKKAEGKQEAEARAAVHTMSQLLNMVASGPELSGMSIESILPMMKEEKTDIIALSEDDFDNKEYIIRIEVKDSVTGEKTSRGRIKISDSEEGVTLQADLGFEETESSAERVHATLFTHLVQAVTEFIQDDLVGE